MAQSRFNNADALSAGALALLGAYIVIEARQWTYLGADGPGPGFFPIWYGIALIALSLAVIGARVYRLRQERGSATRHGRDTATAGGGVGKRREIGHALSVWAAFVVSIALLQPLGFLLAFGLLTFFIVAVIYRRAWTVALAVSVAASLGFYVVFTLALGVALPTGRLGF